jgi:hypothetical protein
MVKYNRLAIVSLALSVAWLFWFGSIFALVLGYAARWQLKDRKEQGNALAVAAIVIGWVGIGVLFAILGAVFVHDRGVT